MEEEARQSKVRMSGQLIHHLGTSLAQGSKSLDRLSKALLNAETNLVPYRCMNLWGYSSMDGSIVVPCIYDYAREFVGNHAVVNLKGDLGLIDKTGSLVLPHLYDQIVHIGEGFVTVFSNNWKEVRVFNYCGEQFGGIFRSVGFFQEGLAQLELCTGEKGFMNGKGEIKIVEFGYDYVGSYYSGLSSVKRDNRWGYINKFFVEVIECKYTEAHDFSEGFAMVRNADRSAGYIDRKGDLVIPMVYDTGQWFSEGLAAVTLNGKAGYIDSTGEFEIPLRFDTAFSFEGSFASAGVGVPGYEKFGIIDRAGDLILDYQYDESWPTLRGTKVFARVKKSGLTFIVDLEGNVMSERDLALYSGGIYRTEKGYSNLDGTNYWKD